MIMSEPTEECITDFWSNGSLKKLPLTSSNPRFMIAAALLRCSCDDKDLCRKTLSEDYFRLFDLRGLPMAPPHESLYTPPNNDSGRYIQSTSEFYESYGWKPKKRNSVPDDHLGIELLFLTHLIDQSMHIDDEPSYREMKKEIRRFIEQHILSWVSEWNKKVQESAHTSCYKGIGTLIHACVEDIYGIMS